MEEGLLASASWLSEGAGGFVASNGLDFARAGDAEPNGLVGEGPKVDLGCC